MCKNKALCDKIDIEKIEEFVKENLCFECGHYASCHICNGAVCSEYEDECEGLLNKDSIKSNLYYNYYGVEEDE